MRRTVDEKELQSVFCMATVGLAWLGWLATNPWIPDMALMIYAII